VLLLVGVAAVTDVRRREVPTWLTVGGGLAGLLLAAVCGWPALARSLLGLLVGGALLLPFVRTGGFGASDALLLAAVEAWRG
jgi:Flp pilus assembly protein protease CpaA